MIYFNNWYDIIKEKSMSIWKFNNNVDKYVFEYLTEIMEVLSFYTSAIAS